MKGDIFGIYLNKRFDFRIRDSGGCNLFRVYISDDQRIPAVRLTICWMTSGTGFCKLRHSTIFRDPECQVEDPSNLPALHGRSIPFFGMFIFFGSTRTLGRSATSLTLVHMGPGVSNCELAGRIPSFETMLRVDFKVYREFLAEGDSEDPSVSVPNAIGAGPATTNIPDPYDEPPGL